MGRKDEQKNRRHREKTIYEALPDDGPALIKEKQRARDLRQTSWWRKKKSAGKCHYCGGTFPPDELTMDHLIPLSRGGKSERQNLVPACKECNNRKKYLLPAEWEEYLHSLKNM